MTIIYKQFENPLGLDVDTIFDRLRVNDADVKVFLSPGGLVDVSSTQTDEEIKMILSSSEGGPIENRFDVAVSIISDVELGGRTIASITNTEDTNALMQVICYLVGVCDENGIILSTPDLVKKK